MILWIVDSDISSASLLKKALKGMGHTIELFYDVSSFLSEVQKAKKEKKQPPDIIFMDIDLQGGNGFDLYQTLVREDPLWSQAVCFWTNVSYGTYEKKREECHWLPAPFLQKNRVDRELKKILPQFEKSGESQHNLPSLSFTQHRFFLEFQSAHKALTDLYYEGKADKEEQESLISRLIRSAVSLQWPLIVEKGEQLLALKGVKTAGSLKLKKEFKELLVLCEKEIKKH